MSQANSNQKMEAKILLIVTRTGTVETAALSFSLAALTRFIISDTLE